MNIGAPNWKKCPRIPMPPADRLAGAETRAAAANAVRLASGNRTFTMKVESTKKGLRNGPSYPSIKDRTVTP